MVVGMRFQFFLACLFALLSAANSSAQQTKPAQQILPDAFGSWHVRDCGADVQKPALSQEAGERDYRQCQFTSGRQTATIAAGKYRDPSSAYEVYTSLLEPGMQPSTVGRFTAVNDNGLVALVGNIVLRVKQPRNVSTKDLQELTSILAAEADRTPLPPIREYLPKEDLVNATQRYALGPLGFRAAAEAEGKPEIAGLTGAIGFAKGAEAILAQYRRGGDTGVLLLIDYPTPQLAELHSRHLETALEESAKLAGTKIERRGSLLFMVIAPTTPAFAEALRSGVNYQTQVTWNEPSQTASDAPLGVVLYRIFVGTGVFMIMAVVFGVAFGGVRVFTKRLFPGKVFDRYERLEVLQLGLSGKPIDTRDLY
jgi:hypothetical protein